MAKVAVLVGSLRKLRSIAVAHALAKLAPPALCFAIVEIADLPLYNQDLDDAPPAPWTAFRAGSQRRMPFCSSRRNTTARCQAC